MLKTLLHGKKLPKLASRAWARANSQVGAPSPHVARAKCPPTDPTIDLHTMIVTGNAVPHLPLHTWHEESIVPAFFEECGKECVKQCAREPAAQGPAAWCTNKDLRHVRTWHAGWIIQRKVGARWHTVGTQLARSWRAPTQDLARANSSVGARQVVSWRAPTSHLARAKPPVGARQIRSWRANLPLGARQNHAKPVPAHFLDRLLP